MERLDKRDAECCIWVLSMQKDKVDRIEREIKHEQSIIDEAQRRKQALENELAEIRCDHIMKAQELLGEDVIRSILLPFAEKKFKRRLPHLITNKVVKSNGKQDRKVEVGRLILNLIPTGMFYVGKTSDNSYLQRWRDPKHYVNNPQNFVLVFQTEHETENDEMETAMIEKFRDRLHNKRKGGSGKPSDNASLFYVYVIY